MRRAFSATETLESHFALVTKQTAPVLGPQQLVSCMANPDKCGGSGGCQGATQPLAFTYTETTGLSLESSYPYHWANGNVRHLQDRPSGDQHGPGAIANEQLSLRLLAQSLQWGPFLSRSPRAAGRAMAEASYSGSCDYDMDHAVQLVGYGEDSGRLYWLVRNSWGSGWGESGYIRLERFGEGSEPCGTDSTPQDGMACAGDTTPVQYCGKCAILSASSYHHGCERGTSDANSSLATFPKPFPKPFLLLVLGLSKECRGVNASLYQ